jgi:hypothetical protein
MMRSLALAAGLILVLLSGAVRAQEPQLWPAVSTSLQAPPCDCPPPPAAPAAPICCPPPAAPADPFPLFALQAMLGQELGVRGQVAVVRDPQGALVVEGFYGELYSNLGSSQTLGAGARYLFRSNWPDLIGSVVVGPGIDVFFGLNHNTLILLTPSIDVGWLYPLGNRLELEVGLDAGLGIGVSGHTKSGNSAAGDVTTLISFYTGIRF